MAMAALYCCATPSCGQGTRPITLQSAAAPVPPTSDVRGIAAGVHWLAEEFQDYPHHIGGSNSDCAGRL